MEQNWVKTIAHTSTLLLLPIIAFIITKVISGNIALSLGMVGALSIVRFRHPVRSPLELSVYFVSITMGIAASVFLHWYFLLILSITMVFIILYLINIFYKKIFGFSFFTSSFSEGNNLSTLTVSSKKKIPDLDENENLVSKIYQNQEFSYVVASSNFIYLKNLENKLNTYDSNLIQIQINK